MLKLSHERHDGTVYRSVSHAFSDLVAGDWEFDGLDHTERVATIQAIIKLMEGLMTTGWTEHTNDWDWRISVVWGDANLVAGTYLADESDPNAHESWTDTIELKGSDVYTDTLHYLTVTEFRHDSDEAVEVLIPIAQIRTITVGEA